MRPFRLNADISATDSYSMKMILLDERRRVLPNTGEPPRRHVAVLKGTDVDQPRNLAKSVTVEQAGRLGVGRGCATTSRSRLEAPTRHVFEPPTNAPNRVSVSVKGFGTRNLLNWQWQAEFPKVLSASQPHGHFVT
jgi:hypothetical protein